MVKIAITCAVLLVLCQLAAARSFIDEEPLTQLQARGDETSIDCARELALTLRTYYAKFTNLVKARGQALLDYRRTCENTQNPTDSILCWARFQAKIIFLVSDVLEQFRNRRETFDHYANIVLENYNECRNNVIEGVDSIDDVILELLDEFQDDMALIVEPMNDSDCATDLKNSVIVIYDEFAKNLYARFVAARTIRRRCQLTEDKEQARSCWWQFRVQVMFGITDTIRDVQARKANFDRVTLELLNAYHACRIAE